MHRYRSRTCKLVRAAITASNDKVSDTSEDKISDSSDYVPGQTSDSSDYVADTTSSSNNSSIEISSSLLENYSNRKSNTTLSSKTASTSTNADTSASLNENVLPIVSIVSNANINIVQVNKPKRRKHNCLYCDLPVDNFARHLQRQHSDEINVQQFLSLSISDPKRKQIINKIRKEGDFVTGDVVPVQIKEIPNNKTNSNDNNLCKLLPCIHCKGYYAKRTLRRHVKRCFFNVNSKSRNRHQSDSHTLMSTHFGPNDLLRTSGTLETLQADDISLVAKRDPIICEVARKYLKSHKEKHLVQVARRYMRRLARLLIEVRNREKNHISFLNLLHPSKFKAIVEATKSIASYDYDKKEFKSPSLALQMGTLLKKALNAATSMELQINFESPKIKAFNILQKLIDDDWATEISTEAGQNLNLNRFNKPSVIPMAEDIAKMKNYLDDLILSAKKKLETHNDDETSFKQLIEGTYCNLLLFNKRRVGELQRILLETYIKHQHNKASGDFEKLLSVSEKILVDKLKRIVIRGKRGKGVPVLFDKLTQEAIELTIKHRHFFFENSNLYLFGLVHSDKCISGYHVFRKHVTLALGDPLKTTSLTSTKLRKHLAIIAQVLKMGNEDLEQLATFMGHTTKTHSEWYRLPSDIYQTAKVSKILLLAQKNSIDQFKGRRLDDLQVDEQIIETQNDRASDCEENINDNTVTNNKENETNEPITSVKKTKVIKRPWTDEEKKVTKFFFKNHIQKKKPPKKGEVLELMKANPSLFKSRNWATVKVYVCNQYTKKL
ncbi:hypothetical protein FQR65_LT18362 [Abscondita terminalis]|nr:hypothetical protein FQR65_LT18362 [Abscondita terminalis]